MVVEAVRGLAIERQSPVVFPDQMKKKGKGSIRSPFFPLDGFIVTPGKGFRRTAGPPVMNQGCALSPYAGRGKD